MASHAAAGTGPERRLAQQAQIRVHITPADKDCMVQCLLAAVRIGPKDYGGVETVCQDVQPNREANTEVAPAQQAITVLPWGLPPRLSPVPSGR